MTSKKIGSKKDTNELFADDSLSMADVAPAAELFPELKEAELFPETPEPEKEAPVENPTPTDLTDERKAYYLKVFDAIMFEGSYTEVVNLGTRYRATLRSRTAREDNEMTTKLDGRTFNTMLSYQNQSSLLTLAYSLVDYNGTDLRDMSVADRYTYVCNLPSPVIIVLAGELGKFDQNVLQAVEYGKENF